MFGGSYKEYSNFKKELADIKALNQKPSKTEALEGFWKRAKFSIKFMFTEKEALFFAFLQWMVIVWVYVLWVQMLSWIPDEVWKSAQNSDEGSIADIILLVWSFICVWIAAFPIGILSACMWASYLLKKRTWSSDIASCFKLVLPNSFWIWIFSWIDGWWTMMRILDRLPKKNDRTPRATKLLKEAIYYAWKVGTIGILPALSTGRGTWGAIKHSLELVRRCTKDVLITRAWYSLLCWIVGVWAYIGWIIILIAFPDIINSTSWESKMIYSFYMYACIPVFFAVWIVVLFLRPIYIISSFAIYENYLVHQWEDLILPRNGTGKNIIIIFGIFLVVIFLLYFNRESLWILEMLATPYGEEYVPNK